MESDQISQLLLCSWAILSSFTAGQLTFLRVPQSSIKTLQGYLLFSSNSVDQDCTTSALREKRNIKNIHCFQKFGAVYLSFVDQHNRQYMSIIDKKDLKITGRVRHEKDSWAMSGFKIQ